MASSSSAPRTIDFWFDYSCPYAYLASTQIEALAGRMGAHLSWKPMLLGGVFQAAGTPQNLMNVLSPAKARHNTQDMDRWAKLFGVSILVPEGHPLRTVEALRATLAVGVDPKVVHGFYRAYWVEGKQPSDPATIEQVVSAAGHNAGRVLAQIKDDSLKDELRARTDEAVRLGIFGAPSFIVDGKDLYWGQDRMHMIEARSAWSELTHGSTSDVPAPESDARPTLVMPPPQANSLPQASSRGAPISDDEPEPATVARPLLPRTSDVGAGTSLGTMGPPNVAAPGPSGRAIAEDDAPVPTAKSASSAPPDATSGAASAATTSRSSSTAGEARESASVPGASKSGEVDEPEPKAVRPARDSTTAVSNVNALDTPTEPANVPQPDGSSPDPDVASARRASKARSTLPAGPHTLEVYWDFSSPFSYIGAAKAEELARRTGATLIWRPMLLGALFKAIGQVDIPMSTWSEAKRRYTLEDMQRWARHWNVPFCWPSRFPMNTVKALRIWLALPPERKKPFLDATFRAYWADDRDISDESVLRELIGEGADEILAKTTTQEIKDALFAATTRAVDAGVFGAPAFVVDGKELFWGQDRIPLVEHALRS